MNDKQFDPLDDRFRQAAEQFEPPYDPQDWVAMEKLLNGKKKKRRIFPIWWITDALMVGMVFLFIYQANKSWDKSPQPEVRKNSSETTVAKPGTPFKEMEESKENPGTLKEKKDNNVSVLKNKKATQKSGNINQSLKSKIKNPDYGPNDVNINPNYTLPTKSMENPEVGIITLPHESGKTIPALQKKQSFEKEEIPTLSTGGVIGTQNSADSFLLEQPLRSTKNSSHLHETVTYPDSVKVLGNQMTPEPGLVAGDSVANSIASRVENPKSKKGQFFVSAGFGIEKSGVRESSPGPSGMIYGGFAGYHFHKDWSIKLGILLTDKNYSGGSGIYKLPPGSYYQEITDFHAICKIIEIPLLLSYQFKHGRKSNWLISAGPVTSIMKKEEYHYNYINNSGGTGYGKKYYSTNVVDWFSGFRIIPAYERLLGKRFSLSAEPFIQLPLSGVGQGSVKLYSLGFQLSTSIYLGSAKQK